MIQRWRALLPQFSGFLLVGAAATATQYAILVALVSGLQINAPIASSLGYFCGGVVNYWLNYHWVFASQRAHRSAAMRFVVIATVGLGLNYALMWALVNMAQFHYIIAQVLTTGLVLVWNFTAHRLWTFSAH